MVNFTGQTNRENEKRQRRKKKVVNSIKKNILHKNRTRIVVRHKCWFGMPVRVYGCMFVEMGFDPTSSQPGKCILETRKKTKTKKNTPDQWSVKMVWMVQYGARILRIAFTAPNSYNSIG